MAPPTPGTVDLAALDTGNYPTKPRPPLGPAGSPEKGALVEAARIGEHVVGPWEVDAALAHSAIPTKPVKDAAALSSLMLRPLVVAAGKHQFLSGFVSARRSEPDRFSLVNAVLWFPDAPTASAAAAEFGELDLTSGTTAGLPAARPVSVPNRPDTLATTFEFTKAGTATASTMVTAYTPRGPFVLMQTAESLDGLDHAVSLVAKTLDLQVPAIEEYQAADPAMRVDLPVDEGGLLAKTVPQPPGVDLTGVGDLVYGPHAALHFVSSPMASKELFDSTGMELWSVGRAAVYQARDGNAAEKIVEQFLTQAQESGGKPIAAVPHLSSSRCVQRDDGQRPLVTCFVAADRYAVEAVSPQLADAHQLAAAQYVMLAES